MKKATAIVSDSLLTLTTVNTGSLISPNDLKSDGLSEAKSNLFKNYYTHKSMYLRA